MYAVRMAIHLRQSDCCRVLNVGFPVGRYGLSEKATNYIMPEVMFLPGFRTLIPDSAQWNDGVLQGRKDIPTFTDELDSVVSLAQVLRLPVRNSVLNLIVGKG